MRPLIAMCWASAAIAFAACSAAWAVSEETKQDAPKPAAKLPAPARSAAGQRAAEAKPVQPVDDPCVIRPVMSDQDMEPCRRPPPRR
jgi:hypothetical protein